MKNNEPASNPAFPYTYEDGGGGFAQYPGMTLRDWFAGQALKSDMCPCNGHDLTGIVTWCSQIADAMLTERANNEAPDNAAHNSALDDAVGAVEALLIDRSELDISKHNRTLQQAISALNALRK